MEIKIKTHSILLDDSDYRLFKDEKMSIHKDRNKFYVRMGRKWKSEKIHRLILNVPVNMEVDHINGNGLDNRRENLRICTTQQNQRNADRRHDNTTGYKGVSFFKKPRRFYAQIRIAGEKRQRIKGPFIDPISAAKAYDSMASELFGKFARLNFPKETHP